MRRRHRLVPLLLLALIAAVAIVAGREPAPAVAAKVIPDRYIVTFKPGVEPHAKANDKARAYGLTLRHVYDTALRGFAAEIPPGQLKKLRADPDVAAVVEDRTVVAFSDTRPTGIRRTQADRNPISLVGSHTNPIAVDVAVIDTGIDLDHPDLNVVGGVNCVPGETSYDDRNGHGTHVAGTIAARDNGSGVVGVAPGARLWAVRVLNAQGEGDFSDVICGIDWVTAHAGTIEVANMSLGGEAPVGSCTDQGLHQAVCASVSAGVTYVVAAGNSGANASGFVPAAYSEVITVSAIVDTDGRSGGVGPLHFFYGADDTLAAFSNYGAVVDIAAPGVRIYSTYLNGGYATLDGTSMASPHVAGAAAIYLSQNPGATPSTVRAELRSIAWAQGSPDGFTGDVDDFPEPLLNAGAIGGDPLPPPPPTCTLSLATGPVGTKTQVTCANFGGSEFIRVHWDTTATTYRLSIYTNANGDGTGTLTIPDAVGGDHYVIALGASSGLTVDQPFTVTPSLGLLSTSGKVGSYVTATLKGFGAWEAVSLNWDGAMIKTGAGSATGSVSLSFAVPEAVQGAHALEATGATTAPVATAYTVVPSVALSPGVGVVGAKVTVTLRGYIAGEAIDVRWFDTASVSTVVATVAVSPLGSGTATFVVPEAGRGVHATTGVGAAGSQAAATFTVSSSLTFAPTAAVVGQTVTATIRGFGAAEAVTVRWYDTTSASTVIASATTAANGSGTAIFSVPAATKGVHRVEAVGAGAASGPYGYLTVNPSLVLSPDAGDPGTAVSVAFAGYGAGETVTVRWYTTATTSTAVATAIASATGSASTSFDVPSGSSDNTYTVEGVGSASSGKAAAVFTVGVATPSPTPTGPPCTLAPSSGPVGTSTRVTCANFAPSETVRIYWDSTATTARTSIFTSTTGGGYATLYIPDAAGGAHQVIARGATSGTEASQPFTVTPRLVLSSASGKVGTYVIATLTGFGTSEPVDLIWDDAATLKTTTVSSVGRATVSLAIPEEVQGSHAVNATGTASGLTASASFVVVPSLALSPTAGKVGASVTVTIRGFAAGESIAIRWYDTATAATDVASATASVVGSGSLIFVVPEATKGGHTVEAAGSAENLASASYTVSPSLSMSATSGTVGTTLTVDLTGYGASELIAIAWYDTTSASTVVTTSSASSLGSASITFAVPEATNGSHRVEAVGQTSGAKPYAFYTVKAGLAVDPSSGAPGTALIVALTGYRAGELVTVKWFVTTTSSTAVASATVSSLGSATASFAVSDAATVGDHKVEGTGGASAARASTTFTVVAAAALTLEPTELTSWNEPVDDDFDQATAGEVPLGWTVAAGGGDESSIVTAYRGDDGSVTLRAPGDSRDRVVLIRDSAGFDQAVVTTELQFDGENGTAGIVLAWRGPGDYIAITASAGADQLEVLEFMGGAVRLHASSGEGTVPIDPKHRYRLRAEAGRDAQGRTWVTLYWSSRGDRFRAIASIEGLQDVSGGVGLTIGATPASVTFDDFSAAPSEARVPAALSHEPRSEPTPRQTTDGATLPPVTPTEHPTTAPTEEPTVQPTLTETSTPASPTPELTPTEDVPPVDPVKDEPPESAAGSPQPEDGEE